MFPEERVLVGVLKRKKDLTTLQTSRWYRIPQSQFPRGIYTEYLAFFLSGKPFGEQSGGIHYYARVSGIELLYRRDLLPEEPTHPRANDAYYKISLVEIVPKAPPVLNPTRRPITFINTTWDRFVQAQTIADLYSQADYFVDRIYHALRNKGIEPERFWENESITSSHFPGVRVLCENGIFDASTVKSGDQFFLDNTQAEDEILQAILEEIRRRGGPMTIHIPTEGS